MIRIVIADDNATYRQTLARSLATDPACGLTVAGDCGPYAAVENALHLRPDALLVELPLESERVIADLRALAQRQPGIGVVLLAHQRNDDAILDGLLAGALAWVMRSAPPREIAAAARAVARGESPLDPRLTARIVDLYQSLTRPKPSAQATATLQPEDLLLLRFVTMGLSNKEIALRVGLAPSTVRNRLTGVFQKLGVSHRTQAALIGVQWGLVPRVKVAVDALKTPFSAMAPGHAGDARPR